MQSDDPDEADYEHEDFSRDDWRMEVQNDNTLEGYHDWVQSQIALAEDADEDIDAEIEDREEDEE